MMLLIILLLLSAGLNMVLIFALVLKYDEKKLNIGIVEGSNIDGIEYLELNKSNSLLY
jgi:hypothetical protein